MGVTLHYVIGDESGKLARIPSARWYRAWREKEPLLEYAGQELRVIEVAIEVDRRVIEKVIRVLPFRIRVRLNGRLDIRGHGRLAMRRHGLLTEGPGDAEHVIAKLEVDANYFWAPEEADWSALSELLGVPRRLLEQRIYRPPSQ